MLASYSGLIEKHPKRIICPAHGTVPETVDNYYEWIMNQTIPCNARLETTLARGRPILIDGGLATELEAQGNDISTGLWSAGLLQTNPRAIVAAHRAYFDAGAGVFNQRQLSGYARRIQVAGAIARCCRSAHRALDHAGDAGAR